VTQSWENIKIKTSSQWPRAGTILKLKQVPSDPELEKY
jgi:hypothetical protein